MRLTFEGIESPSCARSAGRMPRGMLRGAVAPTRCAVRFAVMLKCGKSKQTGIEDPQG